LLNQSKFHLQKSVCDFDSQIKSYGWNSEKMFENVKENVPSKPSLDFVHNFWLVSWIIKCIFKYEIYLDLTTFLSPKFVKKSYSTMPKWSLKFYIDHNSILNTIPTRSILFSFWFCILQGFVIFFIFYLILISFFYLLIFQFSFNHHFTICLIWLFIKFEWKSF